MNTRSARMSFPGSVALPLVLALAACGGGGDDAPATTTDTTPPAPSALTVAGTVAVGAPLPGAPVSVACAGGNGVATTASTGAYTLSLSGASLPCVLTATSADGNTVLHSVAPGSGTGTAASNITPLSELLVAQLAGTSPSAYVAAFTGSTTIDSAAVASAQAAVLQVLTAAGLDTTAVTDIVAGTLAAGTGTGYDGVLDSLQATITGAGASLAELTTAVAVSSAAPVSTGAATVGSLLATANAECPSLKSGVHRIVDLTAGEVQQVTVDAMALTVAAGGATYQMTRNAACDYTLNSPTNTRVLVTRSGMGVWRDGEGLTGGVGISMPLQALDVASLAGVYNRVSYAGSALEGGDFGSVTFNAAGVNTTSTNCAGGVGNCTVDANPNGHVVANADGGFDYVDDGAGGAVAARLFGFRNAAGAVVMVGLEADGTVSVFSPQTTLPLPAVGHANAIWQFNVNVPGGTGTLGSETVTTLTSDAATGVTTREFSVSGLHDTVAFNAPFPGVRYRASSGCSMTCSGSIQMPLAGVGITVSVSSDPTRHFMTVSINKP